MPFNAVSSLVLGAEVVAMNLVLPSLARGGLVEDSALTFMSASRFPFSGARLKRMYEKLPPNLRMVCNRAAFISPCTLFSFINLLRIPNYLMTVFSISLPMIS